MIKQSIGVGVGIVMAASILGGWYVLYRYNDARWYATAYSGPGPGTIGDLIEEQKSHTAVVCQGKAVGFYGEMKMSGYFSKSGARIDVFYPSGAIEHRIVNKSGMYSWLEGSSDVSLYPPSEKLPDDISPNSLGTYFIRGYTSCSPYWFPDESLFAPPPGEIHIAHLSS